MTVPTGPSLVTGGGIAVAGGWGDPEDQSVEKPDEKHDTTDEAPAGQEASP
jgi:hypothetical protein